MGASVTGTYLDSKNFYKVDDCRYIKVDLQNADECSAVTEGIDFVFMCAANSSGAEVMERTPLVHLTPNVIMNARMLEASYKNKIKKFCFISSNTVYPVSTLPMTEDDVDNTFFSKYQIVGPMKLFSENMCKMYSSSIRHPMDTVVVRPGNLYGPHDKFDPHKSKVIPALIRRAYEREDPFTVWGDGSDIKDFIYISDFIRGLLDVFVNYGQGEAVNIASGKSVSLKQVVKEICDIQNIPFDKVIFDETKPQMLPVRLISIKKIENSIKFCPKVSLHQGLRTTIEWYAQNK